MSAATVRGLTAGVVLSGVTAAAFVAKHDLPDSPGEITPREVAAQAAEPLAVVTGLGAALSLFASSPKVPGSGSFLGGVLIAGVGAGLLFGGLHVADTLRDH